MTIQLDDVKKYFPVVKRGLLGEGKFFLKAVDGVSFAIQEGQTVGLIGESGCGKTTVSKLILRLETPTGGAVCFRGKDIQSLSNEEVKQYRRSVQAVFQNPYTSLDSRMRIGDAIAEPIIVNSLMSRKAIQARVTEVLQQVGLAVGSASLYPHEFSGGQRQRIAIARALASNPSFIILDEPVSALDVSIRAQILNLLKGLQEELGVGYLLIAHDLALTIHLSHWIEVLYSGKVMESIAGGELYHNALHPYTKSLLKATVPTRSRGQNERFLLPGEVPDPINPHRGCRFHPRCTYKMPKCHEEEPLLKAEADKHAVRCHLYE